MEDLCELVIWVGRVMWVGEILWYPRDLVWDFRVRFCTSRVLRNGPIPMALCPAAGVAALAAHDAWLLLSATGQRGTASRRL